MPSCRQVFVRRLFRGWLGLGAVGAVVCGAIVCGAGCSGQADSSAPAQPRADAPRRVDLLLNWFPEAEHGGFYAAQAHGFFAEEGLEVTIVPGGPSAPVLQNVGAKRNLFGVTNADQLLLARAQGARVTALMAPLQNTPRCVMVHAESGIDGFDKLRDVTLALGAGQGFSEYLKKKAPLTNVRVVPYSGNVQQFLLDKKHAQQAYVFSEPFVARQQGADPRCLMASDIGYNPYTSLLVTHQDVIAEEPGLARKMTRACARGWRKYLDEPAAANRRLAELNSEMGLEILEFGARELRPLCLPDGLPPERLGAMTADRWRQLGERLVEAERLTAEQLDWEGAFTTAFLSEE